ncbi:UDP-Glycosyltransferase/glycogen phosphorylase [Basidiobolus meristosporus CBS 931.73]|uniref:UDP-Glycosyltransferase/glycogen phosphorylase n=1 Tax=Basidiobolus meristosporus CBS 931.73 TaxID=1314790 RepID=A0A1Y1YNR6_9FUNG|nr:UDP-Glycosyltransferase/glycogen phosphorylase [Basidiobolus meristosporus CBS 931.73]|eukprot:ORX99667.1 UDP-Glycosyltransferase/glycogen phosphorylase [Basidiobolus meristosporus CBS 931.73]
MATKTLLFALIGSLGDTLPFLAIAEHLTTTTSQDDQQRYSIIIMAHPEHEPLISSYGFQFAPIHESLLVALTKLTEEKGKQSPWNQMVDLKAVFGNVFKQWHTDILKACDQYEPDLVVLATFPAMCGLHAVSKLASKSPIPYIVIHTVPSLPTNEFAPPTGGMGFSLPFGFLNKGAWSLLSVFNQYMMMTPILRDLRLAIGLPPATAQEEAEQLHKRERVTNTLFIYSPSLLPTPKDWPSSHQVIGNPYFHRDQRQLGLDSEDAKIAYPNSTYVPPDYLSTFLGYVEEEKMPLVYVGLGSMLGIVVDRANAISLINSFTEAILQLNSEDTPVALIFATKGLPEHRDDSDFTENTHEAIIAYIKAKFPENLTKFTDRITFTHEYIPHSYLFPKCDFIVHHGGMGSTHASIMHSIRNKSQSSSSTAEPLYEGAPTWVVPCSTMADQPFWGALVNVRNLGPKPVPFNQINADNAKAAIKEGLTNKEWRKNTGELGVKIWKEGNPAEKVRSVIESTLADADTL